MNRIGIVGGAGPMAGLLLCQMIVKICQRDYGCKNDADFPLIMLWSYPFSQMLDTQHLGSQQPVLTRELQKALEQLQANGMQSIAIACNTLHSFLPKKDTLQTATVVSLIDQAVEACRSHGSMSTLVLATGTSLSYGVFDAIPGRLYLDSLKQAQLDALIQRVLKGDLTRGSATALQRLISSVPSADAVILGCTELSLLHDQFPLRLPARVVVDPLFLTAKKLCKNQKRRKI